MPAWISPCACKDMLCLHGPCACDATRLTSNPYRYLWPQVEVRALSDYICRAPLPADVTPLLIELNCGVSQSSNRSDAGVDLARSADRRHTFICATFRRLTPECIRALPYVVPIAARAVICTSHGRKEHAYMPAWTLKRCRLVHCVQFLCASVPFVSHRHGALALKRVQGLGLCTSARACTEKSRHQTALQCPAVRIAS